MVSGATQTQQLRIRTPLAKLLRRSCWVLIPVAAVAAAPSKLIDYSLKDQFGNTHNTAEAIGSIVLLIGSDGDGADFNALWGEAINTPLEDHPGYGQIYQLPYADLRSVPFFARSFARGMMPEAPEEWVLLDWKGRLAKHYDFESAATNVLVFDCEGRLQYQTAGREPDPAAVDRVVEVLRQQLNAMNPEPAGSER